MAKNIVGNLFPRILDKPLPEAKSARGVWIEDSKGHRYLDASGGAIVVNVGHGREEIAKAVYEQILSCHYVHPTMFTTRAAETLASALANHTPEGLDRFYFLSSGSEAVETAIKLARQIHLADGRPQRFRLVARWKSYHGLSLGALSAMGRTAFRVPYAPMLSDAVHIPPPYCLRCSYGLTFPACDLRCALALAETIENVGPDIVSALLIMDEVMCGMGRTGQWFACQHYDVIPDIITMGKGIAGGVLALSAVGVRSDHFETVRKKSGGFTHGGSFSHHPVAAAAGLATIEILEKDKLVERVARLGIDLGLKLKERLADHPNVADVRGIGFLWGVELVKDKNSNTPFPRHDKVAERVWEALFQKGVLVYKSTGLAGKDGDALLVAPPFVIKKDELTYVADAIKEVLADVLG
jgi:adenosylmethionine-8-amino-7-oxononanoate aminotransferase